MSGWSCCEPSKLRQGRIDVAALNLLNSLLCDGIPPADAQPNRAGCVAVPAQMAVLATLAIHPKYTSKLADSDAHDVSSLATSYLRTVLATVGPINANLRDAFLFRGENGRRRRSDESIRLGEVESGDDDHVRGKIANNSSVWARGQDFWRVLGWAFNCSAQHPHRWRWWQPWLEYMVDVLEADYHERKRLDEERERTPEIYEYHLLQESLLVSYVVPKNSRVSPLKPIISALFADGNTSSQAIFKEVFPRETKVASRSTKKRKRERVDLENDKFGDYDEDSSTGGSEPPTPEHLRMLTMDVKNDTALWAGSSLLDTIPLRLRLFSLVCSSPHTRMGQSRFTTFYADNGHSYPKLHMTCQASVWSVPRTSTRSPRSGSHNCPSRRLPNSWRSTTHHFRRAAWWPLSAV
jgi:hypothetical protein